MTHEARETQSVMDGLLHVVHNSVRVPARSVDQPPKSLLSARPCDRSRTDGLALFWTAKRWVTRPRAHGIPPDVRCWQQPCNCTAHHGPTLPTPPQSNNTTHAVDISRSIASPSASPPRCLCACPDCNTRGGQRY